ncbi:gliding motility-associated C-terminal domain-containing protein [Flavobacterium sediminilitoris]|uniref:Gliding motility-associated C-terminal domain-containing protein n=1 Tax=Flavobacterium sediminilitoris TaxID=2024526 RepID=A0ABY4HKM3_9FLAO|nr:MULTISPECIES: gliding motility-associated C-terminal domain-containing protein [Flavobacterium]UOX32752.1 gliding motility-associated C-terminal domain-containing protein [Flavobacterium sediminilitoris]
MNPKSNLYSYFFFILFPILTIGQDISLYTQINGRYDFTFIGNTLNSQENSFQTTPSVLTSSSATLNLNSNDIIERAYLYWAGCGTGDFDIKLNDVDVVPERTFSNILYNQFHFFSAFADVTSQVQATGNNTYTVSDLDVSNFISLHFQNKTNFAGWALIIVYKNSSLPLNQLNIYDGLQVVSQTQNSLSVNLDALNVIDNQDAKIGFLAWEGDSGLAINETLRINGTILSNPPLNPANNAFNGTNSITNSNELYNMDLDIYGIQNNIAIGDTNATIELTSGRDYVMINAIVTKLNSQLPDATIQIDDYQLACNIRELPVRFTVYNVNSTDILQANTPIAFYVDGVLVGTSQTQNTIPIGESESGNAILTIPSNIPTNFNLTAVVDDIGNNSGIVTELVESNNSNTIAIQLLVSPEFNILEPVISCNLGLTRGVFDFSNYEYQVKTNPSQTATFYENYDDAFNEVNPIFNTTNYEVITSPKEIFIRIEDDNCFAITSFFLQTKNCPPTVYNAVSANNDTLNDSFFIDGLRDIFVNFRLEIYNRWGKHLWTGNNNKPNWNGYVQEGIGSKLVPEGTYFYILYLNDPSYPEPLNGYLYLTR